MFNVFGALKVASIGFGMAGGLCGAAASIPELKEAMKNVKTQPTPANNDITVEVDENGKPIAGRFKYE